MPLLSRVADSVYWMARYIERAENVARFIGVNLNLQLDLPLAPAQQWQPLIDTSGDAAVFKERYGDGHAGAASSSSWPSTPRTRTRSPPACAPRARTRARCARPSRRRCGSRSTACTCRSRSQRSLPEPERMLDAFREIRMGCHLFQGITDATMTHNEAWHFLRLGRMLERADKTSRILDVKYFMLLPSAQRRRHALRRHPLVGGAEVGQRLRDVPQEVRPHHAARRRGLPGDGPRVPARRPLLHQVAPSESLHAITGTPLGAFRYRSEQLMGQLRAELDFTSVDTVIRGGLHEYLDGLQLKMNAHRRRACATTSPCAIAPAAPARPVAVGTPDRDAGHSMGIRVALHHKTVYQYDRPVTLSPQVVRLRPAPHSRTPVHELLAAHRAAHALHQLAAGPAGQLPGAPGRFPKPTRQFSLEVDLVAEMTVINPFDFFLEPHAETVPVRLRRRCSGASWRRSWRRRRPGRVLQALLASIDRASRSTIDFLVDLNQRLQQRDPLPDPHGARRADAARRRSSIGERLVPRLGLAAGPDAAAPRAGRALRLRLSDSAEARREAARRPGRARARTSPICTPGPRCICPAPAGSASIRRPGCSPARDTSRWPRRPSPESAAPVSGLVSPSARSSSTTRCRSRAFTRIRASPSPTPTSSGSASSRSATASTRELAAGDVRLTMGGEPTFVSIDDMDGEEWNTAAMGPAKRRLAGALLHAAARRVRARAACCTSGRASGIRASRCRAGPSPATGAPTACRSGATRAGRPTPIATTASARDDARALRRSAGRAAGGRPRLRASPPTRIRSPTSIKERQLPVNVDPEDNKLDDPEERERLRRVFSRGLGTPTGFVLPLARAAGQGRPAVAVGPVDAARAAPVPGPRRFARRLPPAAAEPAARAVASEVYPIDPMAPWPPLGRPPRRRGQPHRGAGVRRGHAVAVDGRRHANRQAQHEQPQPGADPGRRAVVRTALTVEARDGQGVRVPAAGGVGRGLRRSGRGHRGHGRARWRCRCWSRATRRRTIRGCSRSRSRPIRASSRSTSIPPRSWRELVANTTTLYEQARLCRLGTEKFMLDGRHTGTGGGNHLVLGGADAGRQPVPAAARSAEELRRLLAEPSVALVSLLRRVHRPDQPGAARGRDARRRRLRAGDRDEPADAAPRTRRRPGWWTASSATCSST